MVAMRYFCAALLLSVTLESSLAQNVTTTTLAPGTGTVVKGHITFKVSATHCTALQNNIATAKQKLMTFVGSVTYTNLTITIQCIDARRLGERRTRQLSTKKKVKMEYSITVASTSTASQLISNLKAKGNAAWKTLVESIGSALNLTNFTVEDLVVSDPTTGSSDDTSAARNLYPWTLATALALLAGLHFV